MKILKILAILLILAQTVFAQEQEKKAEGTKLGIRAGVHFINMADWSLGWHVGAVRDVTKLTNFDFFKSSYGIFIQPGLYFFTKHSIWDKQTYWLEIPVLLSIKQQASKSTGFFTTAHRFEIGPYVNFGVLGDFDDVISSALIEEDAKMSRFDIGITATVGYEIGVIWISSSVSNGFINISDYYDSNAFYWKIITLGVNF
jgi:hypothetical protein